MLQYIDPDLGRRLASSQKKPSKSHQSSNAKLIEQTSTFLALPSEVRMMIYQYILQVPRGQGDWDNKHFLAGDKAAILIARKSLLHTCRQMTLEWAPMYYRSTTIVVNGAKLLQTSQNIIQRRLTKGPTQLGNSFLKNAAPRKVQNIRKIEYDLSLPKAKAVQFHGADALAKLMRKYDGVLTSLTSLNLYTTSFSPARQTFQHLNVKSNPWIMPLHNGNEVWATIDDNAQWEDTIQKFLDLLGNWHIVIRISGRLAERNIPSQGRQLTVERVSIKFTKPQGSEKIGSKRVELFEHEYKGMYDS